MSHKHPQKHSSYCCLVILFIDQFVLYNHAVRMRVYSPYLHSGDNPRNIVPSCHPELSDRPNSLLPSNFFFQLFSPSSPTESAQSSLQGSLATWQTTFEWERSPGFQKQDNSLVLKLHNPYNISHLIQQKQIGNLGPWLSVTINPQTPLYFFPCLSHVRSN